MASVLEAIRGQADRGRIVSFEAAPMTCFPYRDLLVKVYRRTLAVKAQASLIIVEDRMTDTDDAVVYAVHELGQQLQDAGY